MFKSKKYVRTITRIPDDLWNEIKNILPYEMPENTISRSIISYRKITSFLVPNITNVL